MVSVTEPHAIYAINGDPRIAANGESPHMNAHQKIALVLSAACCAVALMLPASKPDSAMIALVSSKPIGLSMHNDSVADDDARLADLRQQAAAALARLQAAGKRS